MDDSHTPRHWIGLGQIARTAAAVVIVLVIAGLSAGCSDRHDYGQASADQTVKAAVDMVRRREAERLPELIYADSPEMRAWLNRVGVLLGNLEELALAVQEEFPEELAQLRAEAEAAAAEGRATSLMSMLGGAAGGRGGPPQEGQREAFSKLIGQLLADPYGWIDRNGDRLSTLPITDDMATVTVDDAVVLPPLGIPLRKDGGKWFVSLPTNMPPLSNYMPRSMEEWSILASVVQVLDNTVVELRGDVRAGRIRKLSQMQDKATDKLLLPALIAFSAYSNEMQVRQRVDRAFGEFVKRKKAWAKERNDAVNPEASDAVSPKLLAAMDNVARRTLDERLRKRDRVDFANMSNGTFARVMEEWLRDDGLTVDLSQSLHAGAVDPVVSAWEQAQGASASAGAARQRGG